MPTYLLAYLLNHSSTKALQGITPQEAFTGHKPLVRHLQVFGCVAYAHIPKFKRKTLDIKSQPMKASWSMLLPLKVIIFITLLRQTLFFHEMQRLMSTNLECMIFSIFTPSISNSPFDNHFESIEIQHEVNPLSIKSSPITSTLHSTSKDPPKWVRSLLQNSRISLSEALSSTSRKIQSDDIVNDIVYVLNTNEEALHLPQWKQAMQMEYDSIVENDTWEAVPRPSHRKVIGVKWIYKVKVPSNVSLDKYKTHLVAKGYAQKEGEDFDETFAPTARYSTICIVLALASHFNWKLFQMDVKSAFLNGDLEEEVYVEQPKGFEVLDRKHDVYHLKKALYSLKQATHAWYQKIDSFLLSIGFTQTHADANLYVLMMDNALCILVLYVNDLVMTGSNLDIISWVQLQHTATFDMTNLGLLHYFLGLKVWQHVSGILLTQKKYTSKLLDEHGMQNSAFILCPMDPNSKLSIHDDSREFDSTTYRQLIGSLLYLVNTRPNLAYAMSILSQLSNQPLCSHWQAAQRALWYLHSTIDYGINYISGDTLIGYLDLKWAGCIDAFHFTLEYGFTLGGGTTTWKSHKQRITSSSSTEVEYKAYLDATLEALWIQQILSHMHSDIATPTLLYLD
ncbi:hypothetical protein L7F22_001507 [Adiantum nelumboides]|nr:hypothetical protein [Adiantum nelumboides]